MNRPRSSCLVTGCQSTPVGEGYCFGHYSRLVAKGFGMCATPGCASKAHRGKLCDKHARQPSASV